MQINQRILPKGNAIVDASPRHFSPNNTIDGGAPTDCTRTLMAKVKALLEKNRVANLLKWCTRIILIVDQDCAEFTTRSISE